MAEDASELFVAGDGQIYVAPTGTTMPTSISTTLDAAFVEMGFLTPDGFRMTPDLSTVDIRGWQSPYPLRTIVTERSVTLALDFLQGSQETLITYFGGGSFTGTVYSPPEGADQNNLALVADVQDGTKAWRWWFPSVTIAGAREVSFVRSAATQFGIDLRTLKVDSSTPLFGFDSAALDLPAYP